MLRLGSATPTLASGISQLDRCHTLDAGINKYTAGVSKALNVEGTSELVKIMML